MNSLFANLKIPPFGSRKSVPQFLTNDTVMAHPVNMLLRSVLNISNLGLPYLSPENLLKGRLLLPPHPILDRWLLSKKTEKTNAHKNVKNPEPRHTVGRNTQWLRA